MSLVKQCDEIIERFKMNKKLFDSGKSVEILNPSSRPHCYTSVPSGFAVSMHKLKQLQVDGKYSDMEIYIEGHGLVARSHKVILSMWSIPFFKVCYIYCQLVLAKYNLFISSNHGYKVKEF